MLTEIVLVKAILILTLVLFAAVLLITVIPPCSFQRLKTNFNGKTGSR